MFGFSCFTSADISEHTFAKLLRKTKAIDNFQSNGPANTWYGPDGKAVAMSIYDNRAMTYKTWIRNDCVPRNLKQGVA